MHIHIICVYCVYSNLHVLWIVYLQYISHYWYILGMCLANFRLTVAHCQAILWSGRFVPWKTSPHRKRLRSWTWHWELKMILLATMQKLPMQNGQVTRTCCPEKSVRMDPWKTPRPAAWASCNKICLSLTRMRSSFVQLDHSCRQSSNSKSCRKRTLVNKSSWVCVIIIWYPKPASFWKDNGWGRCWPDISFVASFRRKGWCPLRMNSEQMKGASWFYRGRTPQKTQYDMTENSPQKDFQAVRVMHFKSGLDYMEQDPKIYQVTLW